MMQIIDVEQGSDAWFQARMGIPTASEFKTIIAVNKDAKDKKTRTAYMRKLAGEVVTGLPMESYSNDNMQRGKDMEDEARDLYAFLSNVEPMRVGFIRNHGAGCSPDSLIEENGGLEIKSALPHVQIERMEVGEMPSEHRAQVQGNIWLAEREWWDFASYCPRLPLFVKRVYRDDGYIATLAGAVTQFNEELAAMIERVRSYDTPKPSTMEMLQASVKEVA